MASRSSTPWPVVSAIIGVVLLIIALPQEMRLWAPSFLQAPSLHFGLDLAGGTQLDFRISEQEMQDQIHALEEQIAQKKAQGASNQEIVTLQNQLYSIQLQRENVVEAIRNVLERRINALGVSEATITPSYVGDERHLLVECPGVIDTQECIDTVGKTIQLEFKEEYTEATEEYEQEIRTLVDDIQEKLTEPGMTLERLGEDLHSDIRVSYQEKNVFFRDTMPKGLESLWNRTPEDGIAELDAVVEFSGTDSAGQPTTTEIPGIFLAEVLTPLTQTGRTVNEAAQAFDILAGKEDSLTHESHIDATLDDAIDANIVAAITANQPGSLATVTFDDSSAGVLFLRKFVPGQVQMSASHILIAYEGASSADKEITRTKDEALAMALDLKQQIADGASFEDLARQYSDGPSGTEGGSLGSFGIGTMVPAFENVASSQEVGQVSDPVETQFGYHVIRTDTVPTVQPNIASYELLRISGENAPLRATEIINSLQRGEVEAQEDMIAVRSLFFSLQPTGWKDTLLDGKHFRSATVTVDPTTNIPVVQIAFDEEGGDLFAELTKKNIGKRIAIFVGGQLVSAPTVQSEITGGTAVITGSRTFEEANLLAQDLNTGAIPAPIYLSGQRTVEATLGAEALETSLKAALIGIVVLMGYMVLTYRLLGVLANIALCGYALLFIALLKLPLFLVSDNYIVLTLAGMAGIILSIGMAVDANILIFERIKEEMQKGKMLKTAAETGFTRAWPSIRDGNISTLITCAILFVIGTSIVRGFAITLSTGVIISMFTAIVITRFLVRKIATSPLGEKHYLFNT